MNKTRYASNFVAVSLAAVVAGCAAQAVQQPAPAYRVELPVLVNGQEVPGARATVNRGPTGTCSDSVSLFTDPSDARVQYSVLEKACDSDSDGTGDYRESTRIGRGETEPYRVELLVSRTGGANGQGRCLVLEYGRQDGKRVLTKNEVVDCQVTPAQAQAAATQ